MAAGCLGKQSGGLFLSSFVVGFPDARSECSFSAAF
jgi:hypothetical protein